MDRVIVIAKCVACGGRTERQFNVPPNTPEFFVNATAIHCFMCEERGRREYKEKNEALERLEEMREDS